MLCIINSYYIFKPFEMVPTKTTKTSSFVKFLHFKKREKKSLIPYSNVITFSGAVMDRKKSLIIFKNNLF